MYIRVWRRRHSTRAIEIEFPIAFVDAPIPEDNIPTEAKIALGRHLFYDKLLSGNESYSCGTCHQQSLAFTDGKGIIIGSTTKPTASARCPLPISLMQRPSAGNPTMTMLEAQALVPMFGEEPVEPVCPY